MKTPMMLETRETMLEIAVTTDGGYNAHLGFNRRRMKRFTTLSPSLIAIMTYPSFNRRRVECFIEQTFHNTYGAKISNHYPTLMSVHDEEDTILAAVGFRFAKDEPLFLERYLNVPIEQKLRNHSCEPIEREVIAEVGNLASLGQGASIFLFAALNAYLAQQGIQIDTFTATDSLHRHFTKLGMNAVELGKANQERLLDRGASWGTYYKENPRVVAGNVQQVLFGLHRHLQLVLEASDADMTAQIHPKTHTKPHASAAAFSGFLPMAFQGTA